MKKHIHFDLIFWMILVTIISISCQTNEDNAAPASSDTGSISAKFNGLDWRGTWATSLIANLGGTQVLTINGQFAENIPEESVSIGISSFTGVGNYNYGGPNDKVTLSVRHEGINYSLKTISFGGGGGTGTIKITEFVRANGILNPGKAIGEFSGTVVSTTSNQTLTITNGKFNSVIVL